LIAQNRKAYSEQNKQYLNNKHIADSIQKAKQDAYKAYKKPNPNVVTYDSKGNKVETSIGKNGMKVTTTTIKLPSVLNRPFSIDTINKDSIYIKVFKSKNRLQVYHKGRVLTAYKCVFGPNDKSQKLCEGDRCTPEGTFTIINIKEHEKWEKFMLLDYPNEESKRNFELAKAKGEIPTTARIGGNVGIHGIWANGDNVIDMKHNWTDGCVGLKNSDVNELAQLIIPGVTRITIFR
jgi:lipoprotein-anchoring transpeptidase ErfK/SrfK